MDARDEIGHIHPRMPLLIPKGFEQEWLETSAPMALISSLQMTKYNALLVD
jgi:putative SOS response-associated peptidase YedK